MRGVVPTELNRLTTRSRQRGFTLIEIAIAMAVIGLLLGATVMSSRMLEERRQIKMEMEGLRRVSDAIVGYALRNRTRERVIKFVSRESPHMEWAFRLPAGRPYLPCPDWNGDGYEDRIPSGVFIRGVEVRPDLTVTANITAVPHLPDAAFLGWVEYGRVFDLSGWFRAHPYGDCQAAKGTVPWRTLGVEPSDGWGNRRTYFADPVFSNSIFGFGRQTIADTYDPRVPRAPGMHLAWRYNVTRPGLALSKCPAVICNGGHSGGRACLLHRSGSERAWPQCAWDGDLGNLILKAGGVAWEDIPAESAEGMNFSAGAVVDGLPFVLVSHGPNGRFAVNHWASAHHPVCNQAWQTNESDTQSSLLPIYAVSADERALAHEAVNGARVSAGASCLDVGGSIPNMSVLPLNSSFFVWEPPGIKDRGDFDDLLVWKTREELTTAIRGRIPRLPHMVIAYFPE